MTLRQRSQNHGAPRSVRQRGYPETCVHPSPVAEPTPASARVYWQHRLAACTSGIELRDQVGFGHTACDRERISSRSGAGFKKAHLRAALDRAALRMRCASIGTSWRRSEPAIEKRLRGLQPRRTSVRDEDKPPHSPGRGNPAPDVGDDRYCRNLSRAPICASRYSSSRNVAHRQGQISGKRQLGSTAGGALRSLRGGVQRHLLPIHTLQVAVNAQHRLRDPIGGIHTLEAEA